MILTPSSYTYPNDASLMQTRQELQYPPAPSSHDEPEQVLSFAQYYWLLRTHWWKIALAVTVCTTLALFLSFRLTPIYESTARVAIDLKTPSSVIGEASVNGSTGSDADQVFNTELQLIQSDTVLRPVAEQFHLLDGMGTKKVQEEAETSDAPVSLANLTVTHPVNSFLINITYRSKDRRQAAAVANAVAHSYIQRGMEMRAHSSMEESAFMEQQMGELKKNMDDSASALAGYEKQLGLINPEEKTSILTARLLQLNSQYTDAQNDRVRKEVDFRALRSGSLAAIEVSPQAVALANMEESVHAAQEKMAAAKTVYGPNYPEYKRAANSLSEVTRQYNAMQAEIANRIQVEYQESGKREKMLHDSLMQAKAESDELNANSMQYQELKREAEANKTLYDELFRKVKEAGINGAFQGSAIRIADEARPQLRPVFPNKTMFTALAFLLSLGLSVITVIVASLLDTTLRDPEQARRAIGVDVLGILPQVRNFSALLQNYSSGSRSGLALQKPSSDWFATAEFYEEAIYTLLSTILISRRGNPLRSILFTSAAPGEGKSSCAAHMAIAHARQGLRTLLIDADLRRPFQQRYFGLGDHIGLADAIVSDKPLSELRQQVEGHDKLHVVTAGIAGGRAFDRVGKKVEEILMQARAEYDVVFIDAPPMLCFNEPVQLASVADGVLVVSHAGETNGREVAAVLATLRRLRANILGLVLNRVQQNMSSSYQPYQSYYRRIYSAKTA
ncbi:MAG TPA: polysaccharide biosynthesis tyrosine autokinase [Acidisarcina sp.]